MNINKIIAVIIVVLLVSLSIYMVLETGGSDDDSADTKIITDMRGVAVKMKEDPTNVVIVDKGFIAQSMIALGVEDRIVATGGLVRTGNELTTTRDTLYLCPDIISLPNIGYTSYGGFNLETLMSVEPDLVIWRQTNYIKEDQITTNTMEAISENLKVPLFVINDPGCDSEPSLETNYEGIRLLGDIFNVETKADHLVEYLQYRISDITNVTSVVNDTERPTMMFLGLAGGGSGYVYGKDYGNSLFAEEVAMVQNVYPEFGYSLMSAEQLIELDPDVIILVDGPVNPIVSNIYNNSDYDVLRNMSAIKDHRVHSIGQMSWWSEFMLNFPSILMIEAKAAHPQLFEDFGVLEWMADYDMGLYGLNETQLSEMMFAQKLYWMETTDF